MYINTPVHAGTCIVRIIWEQFDALWCGCERLCRCTHMCSCMRSTWCIFAHLLQRHNHNFSSGSVAVMKRQSNGVLFFLFSYHLHNQNTTTPTLTTTNKKNNFFSFTRAKKRTETNLPQQQATEIAFIQFSCIDTCLSFVCSVFCRCSLLLILAVAIHNLTPYTIAQCEKRNNDSLLRNGTARTHTHTPVFLFKMHLLQILCLSGDFIVSN